MAMDALNPELIKKLVDAVRDYLNASDGCDDDRIAAMSGCVHDVLMEAHKIPALRKWASRILADHSY
jgi:hypothetical protein